jgi:outer membrane protein assembly factor BamD (BamD/ComL family)
VEARRFSVAQYWLQLSEQAPRPFWKFNFTDKTRPMRGTLGHSVRTFHPLRIDDPTGELADDATLAAGNAWFARGGYIEADNFYTDLRKTFPSSEHQFRAHLLGLKSKLESYQGPDYSAVPLIEAEKLVKQIHKQFPREAAKEREYLTRAYAEVRFKLAEREWKMASYYDRRKEYGAARFYYASLVDKYSETQFAQKAEQRINAIHGEPNVPDQPLEWLVELFPEEETVEPMIATQPTGTSMQ